MKVSLLMSNRRSLKIFMVGHSYGVTINRRLCHEVALVGGKGVEVTVAAPSFYHGDLRPIVLEKSGTEPYALEPIRTFGSKYPITFVYGVRLREQLMRPWDIVHAWEEPYILSGAQIAWWTSRESSLIYSTFQNQPKRYPPPFCWTERHALRKSAGWTAFGETIATNLKQRPGYIDRPTRTIPLGVDGEVYRPDRDARSRIFKALDWSEAGPPVVGYLGRFVPEKGLHLLMRSLDQLAPGSWRALFVGGGPMESELKAWSATKADNVRVVTGVSHSGVPAYLNAFDMLVAPSQTTPRWKEQLGRMLLEAMATGVPIIASDSGEIPYVVADIGRIVGESDEQGWVDALRELIDSPDERRRLGELGLERSATVYAWPRIAQAFLDFFHEVRDHHAQNRPEMQSPSEITQIHS